MNDYPAVAFRGAWVPLTFASEAIRAKSRYIINCPLLMTYLNNFSEAFTIDQIEIASVTFFGPMHVGMLTLKVKAFDGNRHPVTANTVFLRGDSVAILVILHTQVQDYLVLVQQDRLPVGARTTELPAGMLDGGDLVGKTIDEIREELGIEITADELRPLGGGRNFTVSPGGSDEHMAFFVCERTVDEGFVRSIEGRRTGKASEGENITVIARPLQDVAHQTTDAKTILGVLLYVAKL